MEAEQDWSTPSESIDLATLDELVKKSKEAWDEYDAKKKVSSEAHAVAEKIDAQIVATLQSANKSKYFVDGLGTAYLINKYVVRNPKDNTAKRALFDYIKEKYGEDVLLTKLAINHATLNAFYNEECDALAKEGKTPTVPGVEEPTHEVNLGFRKG